MFEKTCCDKNMAEPFTCGQLRLDVDRLTAQLADRDAEITELRKQLNMAGKIWCSNQEENTTLRNQLAECEKEVERLSSDLGWANKQIQLKDIELDQAMVQIEISSEIARKQAAQECLERIKYQSYYQLEEWLKKHFRLEG